jgi:nicotinate phosphoribosyltransferase
MTARLLSGPNAALLTDFYELTMMAGYLRQGRGQGTAVFEYFFRGLPQDTGFCVFAGLEDLLGDLESLRFDRETIDWLRSLGVFDDEFLSYLAGFRFSGDIWAAREGSAVFPHEPVVRVRGLLPEAQLVETILLNRLNYQTLVATKAARVCFAAEGDPVMEFGLRRAQGPDGGVSGSRAAFIGGCSATSNVLAGKLYGIPVRGTMAHSWIMSYEDEKQAFADYIRCFPSLPTLLLDTYDTETSGIENAVAAFSEARARGWGGEASIRLDSGDLAYLSKLAHERLEAAGFLNPVIIASNSLNEYLIADLKHQGAKINGWGVGTELITGGSEPALGGVYKMAAFERDGQLVGKVKISSNPEKTTDPGVKCPVRFYEPDGCPAGDVLFAQDEEPPATSDVLSRDRIEHARVLRIPGGARRDSLLVPVMKEGRRTDAPRGVREIRDFAAAQINALHPELRRLRNPARYWVGLSERLADEKAGEILRLTGGIGRGPQ